MDKEILERKNLLDLDIETRDIDEEKYELTAVASTEAVDRYGDVIKQDGWDLSKFKKNPVIPWGHDYSSLPVGRAIKIWIEDNKLLMRVKFAVEEYDFAKTVFKMYANKFLKGFSVGFKPLTWEDKESKGKFTRYYTASELLEVSAVSIPANPEALALAVRKGVLTEEESKKFTTETKSDDKELLTKLIKVNAENHEATKAYRKSFEKLRKTLGIEPTGDELADINKTFEDLKTILNIPMTNSDPVETQQRKARPATTTDLLDLVQLANKKRV